MALKAELLRKKQIEESNWGVYNRGKGVRNNLEIAIVNDITNF